MRAVLLAGVVLFTSSCGPRTGSTTRPASPATAPEPLPESPVATNAFAYPSARTVDVVDDYHGTSVADPYRWLEDADAPDTAAWVEAENQLTHGFLDQVPARAKIAARLTQLWNYERYGLPGKQGGAYFFSKNDGLQNQAVLYVTRALDAEPRVLLDPNTLSTDGTVALSGMSISEDGKLMAYQLAAAGSDWNEIRVRDVATGQDRADVLRWIKWSGMSWTKDSAGFYYGRYDEPKPGEELAATNYFQKLYYHRVGTEQSADVLVYERKDEKEWAFGGDVTEDGRYLVISVSKGTDAKNQVFYKDLHGKGTAGEVIELVTGFANEYSFLGNLGTRFYFKTDLDAPRGRVIVIDLAHPERAHWKEVVAHAPETLESAGLVGGKLVTQYLKDAHSLVRVRDTSGKLEREVELPGLGSALGFGGRFDDAETFFAYSDYTSPTSIYRYDLKTGESRVWKRPEVAFDPAAYETEQVFITSKDGTQVPLFIVHKKGLARDGSAPTILYGYGGFNISLTPAFSVATLVWLEMGGVYAVANLRGGGEYGEDWHQAGVKARKQNVFDDFIGAAEWLIAHQYTSTPKLAIAGGSNGGLLVGACMTQRPELFGAALPAVGVMDMLRYHKFTIGWAWADDYGSSDDAELFPTLYAYSPYHQLLRQKGQGVHYPPTLVTTADHDDRVVPGHSFKFAAALQAAQAGDAPVLIRVDVRAGHGAGKPTSKLIATQADVYAFLVKVLGVTTPSPG
jgi:prolyl oligopeptidase